MKNLLLRFEKRLFSRHRSKNKQIDHDQKKISNFRNSQQGMKR